MSVLWIYKYTDFMYKYIRFVLIKVNYLRKDYLLNRWVIVAEGRGKRPSDFARDLGVKQDSVGSRTCFFCPGMEEKTPPEIDRIECDGNWLIRCFPNKYPATTRDTGDIATEGDLCPAYGSHEVIVETPEHGKDISDLSVAHLTYVFDMYQERIAVLTKDPKIKYVSLFKNHGRSAGASLDHSHTQLVGLPMIPPVIEEKLASVEKHREETGKCLLCDVWHDEKTGPRLIFEDDHAIAFAPFASRFSFEVWVMPNRHMGSLSELGSAEKRSIAGMLKKVLLRLKDTLNDPAYNIMLNYSPAGKDLHLHFEITPRLGQYAGLELGSEVIINTVSPEVAAKHYRGD